MTENINKKVIKATKWSIATEICAKLFLPISGLFLARILSPEAFGIVATLTMIISFADILSEAGFHKYIIQHEFSTNADLQKDATVAFWSNQSIAIIIWFIIIVFRHPLATIVGSPEYGNVLIVACANIPLIGFSSIQTAFFRRDFDFKTLFIVRICTLLAPLLITIPLALILRNFWALIIGTLFKNILSSIILYYYSSWKPILYFSFRRLRNMLSFSFWSMIETLSIWLNQYIDVCLVGVALSQYYLGLYKTSMTIVGQLLGLITSILTPIIFSTLSRLQNDDEHFFKAFFKFQKLVSLLVLPIGFILYAEKEMFTTLLLGDQWKETANFIGSWALCGSISIATTRYCSEMYRSKGRPMLCFLAQIIMFVVLVPGIIYTVKMGFQELCIFRSLVELVLVVTNLIISYIVLKMSPLLLFKNIGFPLLISFCIFIFLNFIKSFGEGIIYNIIITVLAFFVYIFIIFQSKNNRNMVFQYVLNRKIK